MQEDIIDYEGDVLPGNLAVITTKHVIHGGAVIQLVVRDSEGDWQFLPHLEEISESDAMIMGLDTIVNLDTSVLETLKMPLSHKAWRRDSLSAWQYYPYTDEQSHQLPDV